MLMIALLASGMFYLLAPIIASYNPLNPGIDGNIFPAEVARNEEITQAILGSLPYIMGMSVLISLISAFFFQRQLQNQLSIL